jgi:uncharacterized protein YkwD
VHDRSRHDRLRHGTRAALLGVALLALSPAALATGNSGPFYNPHYYLYTYSPHGQAHHHRRHCADADKPAVAASDPAMRAAVLCLINRQRSARHLPALRDNRLLDRSAHGWSVTMVQTGAFTHGADFAARITAVGFDWSAAGENIATGFQTPRQVVAAWMASKDHCQNILDPDYREVGTGVSRYAVRNWASGPSTWTQDFALQMGAPAPSGNWGPANGCPY